MVKKGDAESHSEQMMTVRVFIILLSIEKSQVCVKWQWVKACHTRDCIRLVDSYSGIPLQGRQMRQITAPPHYASIVRQKARQLVSFGHYQDFMRNNTRPGIEPGNLRYQHNSKSLRYAVIVVFHPKRCYCLMKRSANKWWINKYTAI